MADITIDTTSSAMEANNPQGSDVTSQSLSESPAGTENQLGKETGSTLDSAPQPDVNIGTTKPALSPLPAVTPASAEMSKQAAVEDVADVLAVASAEDVAASTLPSATDMPPRPSFSSSSPSKKTLSCVSTPLRTPTPSAGGEKCFLLRLPLELIDAVLSLLDPLDLAVLSQTCQLLHRRGTSDAIWRHHVQKNVPGVVIETPNPFASFRELYVYHEPYWFLTRQQIWFCDRDLMGKMIVVRYDERRGCIEGYLVLADKKEKQYQHWPADNQVIIHAFEPRIKLHLDKPVLQLSPPPNIGSASAPTSNDALASAASAPSSARPGPDFVDKRNYFAPEVSMSLDDTLRSNLLLAKPIPPPHKMQEAPSYGIWPPPAIPAKHRVENTAPYGDGADPSMYAPPRRRADATDQAFRIRQWIEYSIPHVPYINGRPLNPPVSSSPYHLQGFCSAMAPAVLGRGVSPLGEEVITYATLDPALYTPTPDKPWRGIWVGDYCGHGGEFLLVHQPDDDDTKEPLEPRMLDETEEQYQNRRKYRGRLEAIKLTGDVNIPRGEYTFIADDLGEGGFVANASEPPFTGCRIVKSMGHIASHGFQDDKYIDSQLLLISENRLAQYWVGFGHISFFERVDISQFLDPKRPVVADKGRPLYHLPSPLGK